MRKLHLFLVPWLLVALVPGCRPPVQRMAYAIGQKGGCAILDLGGTTIIFEGIPVQGGDVERKMVGSLMVGGSGVGEVRSSIDGLELRYSYAKGQGRFSFGEYTFGLTDEGTRLVFGETTFPVGEKTIRVATDGRTRSE